jgi:hypothetical protein
MTKRLVNFRGTSDFARIEVKKGAKKTGGSGGGIIWSSCQFANATGEGVGGGTGNRKLLKPNGVQYTFSPATNVLAWKFGSMSAELLTQIMEKYPSTTGVINFVYGINKKFSPKNLHWIQFSRPCNVSGTGEGVIPEQPASNNYVNRQAPTLEELVGGMASPRELANYMNRNTPALLEGYNNFWNEAAYIIYRAYKGGKTTMKEGL